MPLWNLTRTLTSAVLTVCVPSSACLVACSNDTSADVPLSLVEDAASSYGGKGRSRRASYPSISGDESRYPSLGFDLARFQSRSVFIRFRAKMPKGHHGLKFVKAFGQRKDDSYANTTFIGQGRRGVSIRAGTSWPTRATAEPRIGHDQLSQMR